MPLRYMSQQVIICETSKQRISIVPLSVLSAHPAAECGKSDHEGKIPRHETTLAEHRSLSCVPKCSAILLKQFVAVHTTNDNCVIHVALLQRIIQGERVVLHEMDVMHSP